MDSYVEIFYSVHVLLAEAEPADSADTVARSSAYDFSVRGQLDVCDTYLTDIAMCR